MSKSTKNELERSDYSAAVSDYRSFFSARFEQSGESVKTLWGSEESQRIRFQVLAEIDNLQSASVLDVGSGFGDFFGYLQTNNISVSDYLGLEITPAIIEVARKRFPKANFRELDILAQPLNQQFDYAIASGILFLRCENWPAYFLALLNKLNQVSLKGFAFNLLSLHSTSRDPNSQYCDPGETLNLVMENVSKHAVLRHDYRENDFTIYCYKRAEGCS